MIRHGKERAGKIRHLLNERKHIVLPKSYFENTKLYLIIIYRHVVCLKKLKEGDNRYVFKQYTTMMLQLYMLL